MSLVCYWTVDSNTCRSEDRRQRPSHLWSSHCQCSKVQIHSILYSLITTERQVFKELGVFSREDSCISVWTISDSYKFLAASICCFCFIFWSTPFTCKGTSSLLFGLPCSYHTNISYICYLLKLSVALLKVVVLLAIHTTISSPWKRSWRQREVWCTENKATDHKGEIVYSRNKFVL